MTQMHQHLVAEQRLQRNKRDAGATEDGLDIPNGFCRHKPICVTTAIASGGIGRLK